MKKQLLLILALSTLLLTACEEEQQMVNSELNPATLLTITSFYPESAVCGTAVAISGENFGTFISDNYVTFNGAYAEVTEVGQGMIVARVPQNLYPGDYTISLSANGHTGASTRFFKVTEF